MTDGDRVAMRLAAQLIDRAREGIARRSPDVYPASCDEMQALGELVDALDCWADGHDPNIDLHRVASLLASSAPPPLRLHHHHGDLAQ